MAYGKSIELFLVNGTADSLITAELSNWNGKAIKIPRIEVASCSRTDISQAGVFSVLQRGRWYGFRLYWRGRKCERPSRAAPP